MTRWLLLAILCSPPLFADYRPASFSEDIWDEPIPTLKYLGRETVLLTDRVYHLKEANFENGRVAVDIAFPGHRGFLGIMFRYQSENDYELVYIRPHKSRQPDALQYTPVFNGMSGWQLYNDERYNAEVDIPTDRWATYIFEFNGKRLSVYVDGKPEPVLTTTLKREVAAGSIGIWGRDAGFFSNFRYEEGSFGSSTSPTPAQKPASGTVTNWKISQVFRASEQTSESIPANITWQPAAIEDMGFINISRYYPRGRGKALVYASTAVEAETAQLYILWFDYSDEVTVFLNGAPIYQGNSTYSHRAPYALGLMGDHQDAVFLPLKKGRNEITFAVSETFGGWGVFARFEETTGLKL